MKLKLCVAVLMVACMAEAKGPRFYEKGTLVEMKSVECGVDAKDAGEILDADDSQHTKSRRMLCQEYLLRGERMDYKIRPKEEKHPALLPIGQQAEFRIHKDRMHVLVPELDNREREYIVVSVTQRAEAGTTKPANGADVAQK